MKRCAAPDCARPARARGYCDTHYRRVRKDAPMTETTQWRGLHNPERHVRMPLWAGMGVTRWHPTRAWCYDCGECYPDHPCYCCLAAEVEVLRAREQAVRDAIEAELERHTLTNLGDFMFLDQALGRILNALDGDNDA